MSIMPNIPLLTNINA